MAEDKDKRRSSSRGETSGSGGQRPGRDPRMAQLAALSRAFGNRELTQQVQAANKTDLFQVITQRLRHMTELQHRELALGHKHANYPWWRTVADQHKGVDKPDPLRWKEAAHLYEQAAYAIGRGDPARARHLLEEAMRQEQEARKDLTTLVETTDVGFEAEAGQRSDEVPLSDSGVPAEIHELAGQLQHLETDVYEPPNRRRVRDPWWTLEEEEEEEENPDGG